MTYQDNTVAYLQQKLWDAAAKGDSATIRKLVVAGGVDIDARNPDGFTAFSLATQHGHHNTALTILAARDLKYFGRLGIAPAYDEDEGVVNPLRTRRSGSH